MIIVKRSAELKTLQKLLESHRPEFLYLRGRRRVGKSWLLEDLKNHASQNKTPFFFHCGAADVTPSTAMHLFVADLERATTRKKLSYFRKSALTWKAILDEIIEWSIELKNTGKSAVIVIDEVQWVATGQAGFVGKLKEAWVRIERETTAKIILCGSSERFFSQMTGGEEKILRGMSTSATLVVQPFSLNQTQKVFPNNWTDRQTVLVQMMTGGVPYYLEAIEKHSHLGFIPALNQAFFCNESRLIDENKEMLGLEFRENAQLTATRVLQHLAQSQRGLTHAEISKLTGDSISTVQYSLEKLMEYKIIFRKINLYSSKPLNHYCMKQGALFVLKDPFLHFYFKVMEPLRTRIERNTGKENLFLSMCNEEQIQGYTGYAFERLVAQILAGPCVTQAHTKLGLSDQADRLVGSAILRGKSEKGSQTDIVIRGSDKVVRVIECKWTKRQDFVHLEEPIAKQIELETGHQRINALITGATVNEEFRSAAKAKGVVLIELQDLFSQE